MVSVDVQSGSSRMQTVALYTCFSWLKYFPELLVSVDLNSYRFTLAIFLKEPLHCSLRGSGLALKKRTAALHPELHRLPQTLLY